MLVEQYIRESMLETTFSNQHEIKNQEKQQFQVSLLLSFLIVLIQLIMFG